MYMQLALAVGDHVMGSHSIEIILLHKVQTMRRRVFLSKACNLL